MSSEAIAIRVHGLTKHYQTYERPQDRLKQAVMPRLQRALGMRPRSYARTFTAIEGVSFTVRRGETVGIVGRNGAGKSTLLQLLCGTLAPSAGGVEINGRVAALLELGSGFSPDFTGRENIYLNASVLGLTREQIDRRYDDIVAFADIGDFIEQPVRTYSSGMVVRLAFAVIAHVDADILVVDEALAVGDAFFTQKCMRFLRAFMERGTVLFVSHDTGAVVNLCNRAIWLHKGTVKAEGAPRDILDLYLEEYYRDLHGNDAAVAAPRLSTAAPVEDVRDQRLDLLNGTRFRNDIEVFAFDPDGAPSFGKGGARITDVRLVDAAGRRLTWCVGGELVAVVVGFSAVTALFSPIAGFVFRDRLGQYLFGDNTYLTYLDRPLSVSPGESLEAVFRFRMPVLPPGDYSVSAAVAEGTHQEHIQHHWVHDALIVKSHASSALRGLLGIPMQHIEFVRQSP